VKKTKLFNEDVEVFNKEARELEERIAESVRFFLEVVLKVLSDVSNTFISP
jgi:hypothetical protein